MSLYSLTEKGEELVLAQALLFGAVFEGADVTDHYPHLKPHHVRIVADGIIGPWRQNKVDAATNFLSRRGFLITIDGELCRI